MKKTIIILAVILTSGLTALSITRNNAKTASMVKIEKNSLTNGNTANLATAD
jgi:hypothetical protein